MKYVLVTTHLLIWRRPLNFIFPRIEYLDIFQEFLSSVITIKFELRSGIEGLVGCTVACEKWHFTVRTIANIKWRIHRSRLGGIESPIVTRPGGVSVEATTISTQPSGAREEPCEAQVLRENGVATILGRLQRGARISLVLTVQVASRVVVRAKREDIVDRVLIEAVNVVRSTRETSSVDGRGALMHG